MTPSDFVEMCRQLKELGVTTVEVGGFKATFAVSVQVPVKKPAPPRQDDEAPLQTLEELKKQQRLKELGRAR